MTRTCSVGRRDAIGQLAAQLRAIVFRIEMCAEPDADRIASIARGEGQKDFRSSRDVISRGCVYRGSRAGRTPA